MKKHILILAALCLAGWQANAQVHQGRMVLTGGIKYEIGRAKPKSGEIPFEGFEFITITSFEGKNRELAISPGIGYFIYDGLEIGIAGAYTNKFSNSGSAYEWDSDGFESWQDHKADGFLINPYITKYFMVSDKFGFMATADTQYKEERSSNNYKHIISSSTSIDEVANSQVRKETSLSFGLSPGLVYFVSEKFALKAHTGRIGYSKNLTKYKSNNEESEYKNKNLGLYLGSGNFTFGLSYYFGGD